MKKIFLLLIIGVLESSYAANCGSGGVILKDKAGNSARIISTYDCWLSEAKDGKCLTMAQISRNERLTGFRSHLVEYRGKQYAFVENWRKGAPAYITGAFNWSIDDVKNYHKIEFSFAGGIDEETHFYFDSKLKPPFESLEIPPPELDGKDFSFAGCANTQTQNSPKSNWKIKGFELGLQKKLPCTPKETTYVRTLGGEKTPVAIKNVCTVGTEQDSIEFFFASDLKSVYRVIRTQYLTNSDPNIDEVINKAKNFFGEPTLYSSGNWLLNYGDAFSISFPYKNRDSEGAAAISANLSGIGLLIKAESCRYSSSEKCPKGLNLTYKIEYELVDQSEVNKQKIVEENRVTNRVKE
jgi:hypothetical protein